MNLNKLDPKTIDALRDLAIEHENSNLVVAKELMHLAHLARPDGPYIKYKLEEYINRLKYRSPEEVKLSELIASGDVAIIPIGFRCFTSKKIKKDFNISYPSLPFDNGFFPISSIVSIFKDPVVNLNYPDTDCKTHTVCIKYENYQDKKYAKGIKFEKSTYDEINALVKESDSRNVNNYLDSTCGYYTLDVKHNFVLAHYNWHKYADHRYSKGIVDPFINIKNINSIMNRRISRMLEICNIAKYIFFIFYENQGYKYMMIDDDYFDLMDLSDFKDLVSDMFNAKTFVLTSDEVSDSKGLLDLIGDF